MATPTTHVFRPTTVAEMLEIVADLLATGEAAIRRCNDLQGRITTPTSGAVIQQDLRTLAANLAANPDLDTQIRSFLPN